jgi:hypothetical protein
MLKPYPDIDASRFTTHMMRLAAGDVRLRAKIHMKFSLTPRFGRKNGEGERARRLDWGKL